MPSISRDLAALQKILLPSELPAVPGYHFAVHYQPCEAAGGDFYGWQITDEGMMGIGVADVAGHGLRAAVVTAMLYTWMAAFKHFNRPLASVTKDLAGFFSEVGDLNTFVTMVTLTLKLETGDFSLRNCGHPSPKLRRGDGAVVTLDQGRMLPLGIKGGDQIEVPESTGRIEPGEAVVLYTDGIPESVAEDGSFFDDQRLDQAIARAGGGAVDIVKSIGRDLLKHRGNRNRRDDECIVVIYRALHQSPINSGSTKLKSPVEIHRSA